MSTINNVRSPWQVTLSVWNALFLREAVNRLSKERTAWVWLLLEPVGHIAFVMFLFATVRLRVISGINTEVWVMTGLLAYFMFGRPAQQAWNAVRTNWALFTYRQVKPVDTVFVRAGLEGFLMIVVATILLFGAGLYGLEVVPADPLSVLVAVFGLWLVALGYGLITSVASELVPELGRSIRLATRPLYFFSGVIFPLQIVPQPYRDWLMYNPVLHGLEATRSGFSPLYRTLPDTSVAYMYGFALVAIFLGLALHRRFAGALVTQ